MVGINHLNIEHLKRVAAGEVKVGAGQRRKARIKLYILEKDGFACRACGSTERLSIDHMLPVREIRVKEKTGAQAARWGTYKDYCQTLCLSCHEKKNKIDTVVWLEGLTLKDRTKWYKGLLKRLTTRGKPWPKTVPLPENFKNLIDENGKIKTPKETKA